MAKAYTVTNASPTTSYTFKTGVEHGEHRQLRPGETADGVILDDGTVHALRQTGALELSAAVEVPTPPRRRPGLAVKVIDAKRNRVKLPARRYMGMR